MPGLNLCQVWIYVMFESMSGLNLCLVWIHVRFESVRFESMPGLNLCKAWIYARFESMSGLNLCQVWIYVRFESMSGLNLCQLEPLLSNQCVGRICLQRTKLVWNWKCDGCINWPKSNTNYGFIQMSCYSHTIFLYCKIKSNKSL